MIMPIETVLPIIGGAAAATLPHLAIDRLCKSEKAKYDVSLVAVALLELATVGWMINSIINGVSLIPAVFLSIASFSAASDHIDTIFTYSREKTKNIFEKEKGQIKNFLFKTHC